MVPRVTRRTGAADLSGRCGTSLSLLDDTIIYDPGTGGVLGEDVSGPEPLQLKLAFIASGVVAARRALPPGTLEVGQRQGNPNAGANAG